MEPAIFGEYFRELRLRRGLTLRAYCVESGEDPANISRIERGLKAPPKDEEVLLRMAESLGLQRGSEEWRYFHDLATVSAGRIPKTVMKDAELVKHLPLLFRTMSGAKFSDEKLDEFVEYVRELYTEGIERDGE
jgi:transcriptional regulator with XRE-family HTH domain